MHVEADIGATAEVRVRHWVGGDRLRRALAGVTSACAALLVVSCASTQPPSGTGPMTAASPPARPSTPEATLIALDDAGEVAAWTTVNDPVMGGRSTSTVAFGDGALVFSGNISLQNNGGFASARSPRDPAIGSSATGAKSLRVHAVGDGKTYLLQVGVTGQSWSYIQRFRTEAAVERTYALPVADFEPVGMRLEPAPQAPPNLDPSAIDQVSVYILDKQQGPFEIDIHAIGVAF